MPGRRGVAALTAGMVLAATAGCTSGADAFCEKLSASFELTELSDAIREQNLPAIERELSGFRELQQLAPEEIEASMAEVVDTTAEVVRSVTGASESGTNPGPVDLTSLNDQLAEIGPAAQKIETFADRNCTILLDQ